MFHFGCPVPVSVRTNTQACRETYRADDRDMYIVMIHSSHKFSVSHTSQSGLIHKPPLLYREIHR